MLSNGRYSAVVTGAGTGGSRWQGLALTAWSDDRVEDAEGLFLYLRDLEGGRVWSVGHQPTLQAAERYAAGVRPGVVTIERADDGIEAVLQVAVAPDADLEVRRLRLRNGSGRPRRIEVTSYAEVVLNDPAAHAAHPAFSKLFVETAVERGVLLARRRPRSRDERSAWLVHALGGGTDQWETDRARFLGRGRTVATPLALSSAAPLSGTVGSVLDPIVCLRRTVVLPPGAEAELAFVLGAAESREAALALAARAEDAAAIVAAAEVRPGRDAAPLEPLPVERGPARPARFRAAELSGEEGERPPLRLANRHGGFALDGPEYVIHVDDSRPPMPWINVIANERVGFLVSEAGAGYTWARNSRENRLTPWANDPIADPYGEALYVRDEDAGVFWSPLPGPVPPGVPVEARHGFGWSAWRHESHGLAQEVTMLVARDEPLKIVRVRVVNPGTAPRRLSLFAYFRLVLGGTASPTVVVERDAASGALVAENRVREDFADGIVFVAAVPPAADVTADRAAFVGPHGSPARPAAVAAGGALDGRTGAGLDPCAALRVPVTVDAGAAIECLFLLGETTAREEARAIVARHREPGAAERAVSAVWDFWTGTLSAVQVETPSPALDVMLNGWLVYQNLSCRLWARSAFYQSGGAFGFRDQLQDAAALVWLRPEITRAQIVLHAAHQFVEGDVLHWWHPPSGRGTRTRFSDDLLWLPYVTASYVQATGDWRVLEERAGFVTARALAPGEDDAYLLPAIAAETADVYEHCCRALDRSLGRGAHGLPLMGTGDWNDGMNRVGREGRGESVWLGFFLYAVLGDFIPLCRRRGDEARAARYDEHRRGLRVALEEAAWDGGWYRRAYYDDGTPLGSAASEECRIDALAQAWAVISGAAPRHRAEQAMDAVERELVSEEAGIVRLLWPPFDRTPHDPGYIKGYVPGIRENGGQYTHAALWVVRALAELGRRERAVRLLEMLLPVSRDVGVYQVEPYVVAADVYGVVPHLGRGGWTWYTGSAGWMYRVAVESVLGVTVEAGQAVRVRPCIPDAWPGFSVHLRLPDGRTRYEIAVANPDGVAWTVIAVDVDGRPGTIEDGAARVALVRDGALHRVRITLGAA